MLSESEARGVLEKVLEMIDADEAEVSLGGGTQALTRFANNTIHQNVAEERYELSVRVNYGGRTARAVTSSLGEDAIRGAVQRAEELAKRASPLADLLPVPDPREGQPKRCYEESTASASAQKRAEMALEVIGRCRRKGLSAAGIVSTSEGCFGEYGELNPFAVMNTKGHFLYQRVTCAQFSTTVHAGESSGWAAASAANVEAIDAASLAERAVDKALRARNPKALEPGAYTVVLEPEAVANLLLFLCEGFGALAVSEGRSFLSGRMGEKIVGEGVTIADDVYHKLHIGIPFDWEGVPKRKVDLIERGKAVGVVHDRATAAKESTEPTGHGLPVPNAEGPMASHLVMEGGGETLEELISSVKRGVLVTRFWYTRVVDPMKVIITGMTRDGTFLIEDGKISSAVMNMRFNESVLDVLNHVDGMTSQSLASGVVTPALKVDHFTFSSGTSF